MPETVYRENRNYVRDDASDVYGDAPRVTPHHKVDRNSYYSPPLPPPLPPPVQPLSSEEYAALYGSARGIVIEDRTARAGNRDIRPGPVKRSSTFRGEAWDAHDDRDRFVEQVHRPGRSVWYGDDDIYDRGQEASAPTLRPTVPVHMRSDAQRQLVGVRSRPQAPGPVDFNFNRDVTIARQPTGKAASTSVNHNHRPIEYVEVRREIPKVQHESQHVPGLFQTVFDVNNPQDASIHLELEITDDLETELETFSQLQRLGNFGAARDYFDKNLEPYLSNPYVFVQYGQMLLDQGDYLAFERLDPEAVFGKDDRPTPRAPESVEGWYRNLPSFEVWSRSRERLAGARRYEAQNVYYDDEPRVENAHSSRRSPPPRRPPPPRDEEIIYERRDSLPRRQDSSRSEAGPLVLRQHDVETVERTRPRPRSPPPVFREPITITRERSYIPIHSPPSPEARDSRVVHYDREFSPDRVRLARRQSVERPVRSPSPPPPDRVHIRTRIMERDNSHSPVADGYPARSARFDPEVRHFSESRLPRSRSLDSMGNYYDPTLDDERYRSHSTNRGLLVTDSEGQSGQDELELLRQNWMLLQAKLSIHRNGSYGDACSEAWYAIENFHFGPKLGSTEIQVVVLALQICAQIGYVLPEWYYTDELQEAAAGWVDWSALFKQLLVEGRIWDFADLYVALTAAFADSADEMLFGTRDLKCSLNDDWIVDETDESTNLAHLGLLLEPDRVNSWDMDEAQSRAEAIMTHSPAAMKSRSFTRWIMEDAAAVVESEQIGDDNPWMANKTHLLGFPGIKWQSQNYNAPSGYIPRSNENPGWVAPVISPGVKERLQLALNLAKELKDYKSQAECYKLLIRLSQDPTQLFQELARLQNETQGDRKGHLETLLSRYLICKDRPAQKILLEELERTGDQGDATTLWARDFVERAVKRSLEGSKSTAKLRKPASFYMNLGLPREVEDFIWQNADHDPPSNRYEPASLAHMRHVPVPLPRHLSEVYGGQEEIRPLSNFLPYSPSRRSFSRPELQSQSPTYVRYDDKDLIQRLKIEEDVRYDRERYQKQYERDRAERERAERERAERERAERERLDALLKERDRLSERFPELRAREIKDRENQELRKRLQQAERSLDDQTERLRRAEDRDYHDWLAARESSRRARARRKSVRFHHSDTSSEQDEFDSSNEYSRKRTKAKRRVASSDSEKGAEAHSDRRKGSRDEERRSKPTRNKADRRDGDDVESPQPSSRNALVVYSRIESPGPLDSDPYITRDVLGGPTSAVSSPISPPIVARVEMEKDAKRLPMGSSPKTTKGPGREPTLEETTIYFQGRTDALTAEPEGAGTQPDSGSEGDTGKLGDRSPPNSGEAESRDHNEQREPVEQPDTYSEVNTGEAGDRDPPNVYKDNTYVQGVSDSAQNSGARPASHHDSIEIHESRRRFSTSRKQSMDGERRVFYDEEESFRPSTHRSIRSRSRSPLDYRGDRTRDYNEAERKLDQSGSKFEAYNGERVATSLDNDEPRLKKQNESIANRPPKVFAVSPGLERDEDEWDRITAKEREKLDRDRWDDTKGKIAHRSVVIDPTPGITRTITTRSRTGPPPAPVRDGIQPLERRTSWRDRQAAISQRNQFEAPLKRASFVFDADGRPQPIRAGSDHRRRAYVGEATSGSHTSVKRRDSIDEGRVLPDTASNASGKRPERRVISRPQSTGEETGTRLRRADPESSVAERSSAEIRKREKDGPWKRKETMSVVHENPVEVPRSVAPPQEPRPKAGESLKMQASVDPEPGISRKPTVADPEPGDE